jgi:bifunctional DNase/RNase
MAEAQAIALQLQGKASPRPLTHDLLKTILEQVGVEFDQVLVNDLKEGTYYARIHLINGGKVIEVDSRPSDAIALALRFHRPIFVERSLFDSAPSSQMVEHETTPRTSDSPVSTKIFGLTIQRLTEALAAHFDLPDTQGVLVTEVEGKSGGAHLQRGDVIVAVEGEPVGGIEELQQKLQKERGHVVSVHIRRNSEESDVSLALAQEESAQTEEEAE